MGNLDEALSKPVFELTLPYFLEAALSVPGNWFGLAPTLLIGPLWVAALEGSETTNPLLFYLILAGSSLSFLIVWISFLRGNMDVFKHVLANKSLYLIGPSVTNGICYFLLTDQRDFSRAMYPALLWLPTTITFMHLKEASRRLRPCAKPKYQPLFERKHLDIIPRLLRKVGADSSFPSGDAAIGAIFAISLAESQPQVAVTILFLSCFGRMYFLAHHLFDTIVGVLTAVAFHSALTWIGWGKEDLLITWWHPLVAQLSLLIFLVISKPTKH